MSNITNLDKVDPFADAAKVNIFPCQRNLIKTFHNEAKIALLTKNALIIDHEATPCDPRNFFGAPTFYLFLFFKSVFGASNLR